MKYLVIFLVIFIFVLLESILIPLSLTLVTVMAISALLPVGDGLLVAFLAGIILDLFTGKTLGMDSLIFLLSVFPIYLYKNRFQADRLRFLVPYSFLVILVLAFSLSNSSLLSAVISAISMVIILPVFRIFTLITSQENEHKLSF